MTGAASAAFMGNSVAAPALTATIPAFVNGVSSFSPVSCGPISVTVANGTGPFTYAWTQPFGAAFSWIIASPLAASTAFYCEGLPRGEADTASFQIQVTDSLGAVATSNLVTVTATRTL